MRVALLVPVALLAACPSQQAAPCDSDDDCGAGACVDGFCDADAVVDGGAPSGDDGGSMLDDGGALPLDAGALDAGALPVDGGAPPVDGGDPPVDGGAPLVDGGAPPVDGGALPVDGGVLPSDGGAPPTDAGACVDGDFTFDDFFGDGTLAGPWDGVFALRGTTIERHQGALRIGLADGAQQNDAYAGAFERFDMTGKRATIEVLEVPSAAAGAQLLLRVGEPEGGAARVQWLLENGVLKAEQQWAGGGNAVNLPYDAAAHRSWRIRFDDDGARWQTSPDGVEWTTRRGPVDLPGFAANVDVQLGAGTYQPVSVPGVARIDEIEIGPRDGADCP